MADETVFIDFETTGVNPSTCLPVQVAAMAVERLTLKEVESIEMKIRFDPSQVDPVLLEKIHYSPEAWKDAIEEKDAVERLSDYFRKHGTWERISKRTGNPYKVAELAGHNASGYDCRVLEEMFKRHKVFLNASFWTTGCVDTMHWARAVEFARNERWEGFSLEVCCKRFGITLIPHDALNDVRATVELARALKGVVVTTDVVTTDGLPF